MYRYYGTAIYQGDALLGYLGRHVTVSGAVLELLGIPFEFRPVRWEDWPDAICRPPASLREVERHFAALGKERRRKRIAELKAELARLEGADVPAELCRQVAGIRSKP